MSQLERAAEEKRYGKGTPATAWLTEWVEEQQNTGKGLHGLLPVLLAGLDGLADYDYSLSIGPSRRGGTLAVLKRSKPGSAREVAFVGGNDAVECLTRLEHLFDRLKWRPDKY